MNELEQLAKELYEKHLELMLVKSDDKMSDQRIYGRADAMFELSRKLKEILQKYKEVS